MDAWEQLSDLYERFYYEFEVRPDLIVEAIGTERSVKLTLVEYDFTVNALDVRHKRYHSTQRNVSTMRELAEALLAACHSVEESNPKWAMPEAYPPKPAEADRIADHIAARGWR